MNNNNNLNPALLQSKAATLKSIEARRDFACGLQVVYFGACFLSKGKEDFCFSLLHPYCFPPVNVVLDTPLW